MNHPSQSLAGGASPPPRDDYFGLPRRDFLKLTALALAVGSLSGLPLSACSQLEAIKNRPIRREITSAAALKDINSFKTAIAKMQALPSTNFRSWEYQASIHAAHARHRSWLFFPWHRAYLYYFEQICRELSGDATFALPYWNWTAHPQIPAVFWDTSSPLYYSIRDATLTPSSVAAYASVGATVVNPMLDETNFLLFAGPATFLNDPNRFGPGYGSIEATPHNYIHGFVGDSLARSMSDNMWSPLDPIFWTHHGRIDELWVEWNILKDHPNTNDSRWTDTEFTEFYDGKGNSAKISVIATILLPLLSYQYDTQV